MKPQKTKRLQRRTIVVTGTPGTGKTTISKSLARQLHANYLPLTRLAVEKRLVAGVDPKRDSVIVDLGRTKVWLRKRLFGGERMTVIDTHVAEAIPRDLVKDVIVLRCHPRILEARLRRKGWEIPKIRENVLAEILDSCYAIATEYYGPKKTRQVDTSRASVDKTVDNCKAILKRRSGDKLAVDWIAVLDQEGLLEKYVR